MGACSSSGKGTGSSIAKGVETKHSGFKSTGTRTAEQNIDTILKAWNETNTTGRKDPPVVRFAKAYQEFINTGKASDVGRATDYIAKGKDARDAFSKLAASRFGSEKVAEIYEKIFGYKYTSAGVQKK